MSKQSQLKNRPLSYYREEVRYFKARKNYTKAKSNYKVYKRLGGKTKYNNM